MVDYHGKVVPVYHCLLTSKAAGLYTELFKYLKERLPTANTRTVMADFEASLALALRRIYPGAKFYKHLPRSLPLKLVHVQRIPKIVCSAK